jgi:hypothetical protein
MEILVFLVLCRENLTPLTHSRAVLSAAACAWFSVRTACRLQVWQVWQVWQEARRISAYESDIQQISADGSGRLFSSATSG